MIERMERIGGEAVRLRADIGFVEAVAAVEPEMIAALRQLERGHYRLTRAGVIAGGRAAGRTGDLDAWFDGFAPGCLLALSALVHDALTAALTEAADAAKKAGAAEQTAAAAGS